MWVCECASVAQVCVEHLHAFTGTLFYLVVHVPRGVHVRGTGPERD